jgi:hypothetical protein
MKSIETDPFDKIYSQFLIQTTGLPMTDTVEQFLSSLRTIVEKRVRDQLTRHLQIDPNADPRKIVEIQMNQEREKLQKLIEDNTDNPQLTDAYQVILDEWLPYLERQLKG